MRPMVTWIVGPASASPPAEPSAGSAGEATRATPAGTAASRPAPAPRVPRAPRDPAGSISAERAAAEPCRGAGAPPKATGSAGGTGRIGAGTATRIAGDGSDRTAGSAATRLADRLSAARPPAGAPVGSARRAGPRAGPRRSPGPASGAPAIPRVAAEPCSAIPDTTSSPRYGPGGGGAAAVGGGAVSATTGRAFSAAGRSSGERSSVSCVPAASGSNGVTRRGWIGVSSPRSRAIRRSRKSLMPPPARGRPGGATG